MTLETVVAAAGYELINLAARGASGSVYRATSLASGDQVALKVLADTTDVPAEAVKAVAAVSHENVMGIIELLSLEDEPAIVSEWVDGTALSELLVRHGALSEARSENIMHSVLDGMEALHAAGLAHGSISANNVVIGDDDHVTLIDIDFATVDPTGAKPTTAAMAEDRKQVGRLFRLLLEERAVNEPPAWRVTAIEQTVSGHLTEIDDVRDALLPSRRVRVQREREPSERPPLVLPILVGLGVVLLTVGAFLLLGPDSDPAPEPTITGIEVDSQP